MTRRSHSILPKPNSRRGTEQRTVVPCVRTLHSASNFSSRNLGVCKQGEAVTLGGVQIREWQFRRHNVVNDLRKIKLSFPNGPSFGHLCFWLPVFSPEYFHTFHIAFFNVVWVENTPLLAPTFLRIGVEIATTEVVCG